MRKPKLKPKRLLKSNMPDSAKAIRLAAMNLLARREQSLLELQQKLTVKFPESQQIPKMLQALAKEGLQSDQRFAEAFVRYRANKGFGPERILLELKQRGVEQNIASDAIDMADINWLSILQQQYLKKTQNKNLQDLKQQAKVQQFLSYRGFSQEAIRRLF